MSKIIVEDRFQGELTAENIPDGAKITINRLPES